VDILKKEKTEKVKRQFMLLAHIRIMRLWLIRNYQKEFRCIKLSHY